MKKTSVQVGTRKMGSDVGLVQLTVAPPGFVIYLSVPR